MQKQILFCLLFIAIIVTVQAQPAIGSQAPEITLKNVDGSPVSLSSFKGKVVIIDFWASWCGPCRIANKTLKNLYAKYKDQGLEIYSISADRNQTAWKRAIKADGMTWINVFDEEMITATKWRIGYLPFTFVVDKRGKIIDADLEAKDLEKAIKKLL
jgi:peroxiredoxin